MSKTDDLRTLAERRTGLAILVEGPDLLRLLDVVDAAKALLKHGGAVITDDEWELGIRPRAWFPSLDVRAAVAALVRVEEPE